MMAVRTAVRGLSGTDLEHIKGVLAAGRRPKVVFTDAAGQIAGQVGQVVAVTDPRVSDEWLVVRFGRDELPFSPSDLALPPKAPPKSALARPLTTPITTTVPQPREEAPVPTPGPSKSATKAPAPPSPAPPSPGLQPAVGEPTGKATDGRSGAKRDRAPVPASAGTNGRAAAGGAATAPSVTGPPAAAVDPAPEPSPARVSASDGRPPARKAARPKPPASLTVTLSYTDGEWTVGATQGAKALAKPYVIRAGEALKMVAMLDVPGVHEAVEEIVLAARTQAEQQAERLRAELAELEARLAELRDVP
jgi:hypothetical protein